MLSALRLVGLCFGLLFLFGLVRVHRRQRLNVLERTLGLGIAVSVIVLSIWPNAADALLGAFSFQRGGGARLIGLLVFSTLVMFFLIFVALARSHRLERTIDQLVRELAKREYRRLHEPVGAPICVVIPAYDEAENVAVVLGDIPERACGKAVRAIVVVDGATDRTEEVVRGAGERAVVYAINRGGGSALKAGFDLAIEGGAEVVVTLDADGQHVPQEIETLVAPIVGDRADLVVGSRVLGQYDADSSTRAAGVVVFNWLCSALMMRRITDCSSGFRAIRADGLARLELRQQQFHTSEMLIDAVKKGFRVVEVPITIRRRRSGVSKKGPTVRYALSFARAMIGTWLR